MQREGNHKGPTKSSPEQERLKIQASKVISLVPLLCFPEPKPCHKDTGKDDRYNYPSNEAKGRMEN